MITLRLSELGLFLVMKVEGCAIIIGFLSNVPNMAP